MNLLEDMKNLFANDLFATKQAGIVIDEVAEDYAKCSMKITPNHLNAGGYVMGGAIFTLADFCFAVAANTVNPVTVTLSSNINFIAGTKTDVLYAESKCEKRGASVCFFITEITDANGKLVAAASANGFRRVRNNNA